MQKTSILQLCAVDFTAWHFLLPLMDSQRKAGFEVAVACSGDQYAHAIRNAGFDLYPIPFERSYNLAAHVVAYRCLKKLFARKSFSVVHTHTPVASMIGRIAAQRSEIPVILYTAHGFYFHDEMNPWVRKTHILLERFAQKKCDHLFTQSMEDYKTAVIEGIAPGKSAEAIGNGVNLEIFNPSRKMDSGLDEIRENLGLGQADGPVVVMIGRLVREKGYIEFFRAFSSIAGKYPGARAVVIGEALPSDHDNLADEIHKLLDELEIRDRIVFTGLRDDVPRLMALGDIYCLPSWREGLPRSIIEAMAAGLPVIATDIRGCREEVVDGETGLLVPVRDPVSLAEALDRLLQDKELRIHMGLAGRKRAEKLFDEKDVIEKQKIRLREILARKNIDWPCGHQDDSGSGSRCSDDER
jgi:glycosyltransferase involved in cell wall biosynthesis